MGMLTCKKKMYIQRFSTEKDDSCENISVQQTAADILYYRRSVTKVTGFLVCKKQVVRLRQKSVHKQN